METGEARTPLGQADPISVAQFWQRFVAASGQSFDTPQPEAWAFGDSVELADELLALVLDGPKRATAATVAEYEHEGEPLPRVGDFEIICDGSMQPRGVIQATDVRVGPLSSVDDQFAYDEGEGDRSRTYWLAAHTRAFQRSCAAIEVEFDDDMPVIFQRFDLCYREPANPVDSKIHHL